MGMLLYPDWKAERQARQFCNAAEPGSDVSIAISRAAGMGIQHTESDDHAWHGFWFHGTWTDEASCWISVDRQRRVVSTRVQMFYD
jgi:hypothetical protein